MTVELENQQHAQGEPEQDVTVVPPLLRWTDTQVPVWVVRVFIAILSGLAAGIGGSHMIIHRGGFSYHSGFWWAIGWSTAASVAVALLVCFSTRFRKSTAARWTVALGIVVATAVLTQDGILTLFFAIAGSLIMIAVLAPAQLGLRLTWIHLVKPATGKLISRFAAAGFLCGLALVVQVSTAAPALAQTNKTRCVSPPVALQIDGEPIDLTHRVGSDPKPIEYEVNLDQASTFELRATTAGDSRAVVTVELVRTAPLDVVRGQTRLIWHAEVKGEVEPAQLTIAKHRDGELDSYSVTVGDSSVPIDMFAGVGTFHVTIRDLSVVDPESATCTAEINVRVVGSGWGTNFGRWVTIVTIVGAAGCGSVALVRPEVALPAGECRDALILDGDTHLATDVSNCIGLESGKEYEFKLDIKFLDVKERDEIAKLKPHDVMRLRQVPGMISLKPRLTIEADGTAVAVTPFRLDDRTTLDAITVHVGSQEITQQIRITSPAADTDSQGEA